MLTLTKAGIHAKASVFAIRTTLYMIVQRLTNVVLNNPSTCEIINPADFGMSRYVHFTSRLTGWNAIKSRCDQLGYVAFRINKGENGFLE